MIGSRCSTNQYPSNDNASFTLIDNSSSFPWFYGEIWQDLRSGFQLPEINRPEIDWEITNYKKYNKRLYYTLKASEPFIYYLYQEVDRRNLPTELVLLPLIESAFSPFAHSFVGASGLWQMMPGTASGFGVKINWWYDGRRDIITSTEAALDYLTYLYHFFHENWMLAIAAYDSGEGRIQHAILYNKKHHKPTDFWSLKLPQETQAYVPRLLAIRAVIMNPHQHGISLPPILSKPHFAVIDLKKQMELSRIADLATLSPKTIRALNPGYRRWVLPPNGPFKVLIPLKNVKTFLNNLIIDRKTHPSYKVKWDKYTIKTGDTLSGIAYKLKLPLASILSMNHLKKNDPVFPHDILLIPQTTQHEKLSQPTLMSKEINGDRLPGPKLMIYTVKAGDHLSKIAKEHHVNTQSLIFWNKLNRTTLKRGQKILIWKSSKCSHQPHKTYEVQKGDTLSSIALHFKTTSALIKKYSKLHSNRIRIGQHLLI